MSYVSWFVNLTSFDNQCRSSACLIHSFAFFAMYIILLYKLNNSPHPNHHHNYYNTLLVLIQHNPIIPFSSPFHPFWHSVLHFLLMSKNTAILPLSRNTIIIVFISIAMCIFPFSQTSSISNIIDKNKS